MTPIVSIITPTYNRLHTLPRLWGSLKTQTLADFEWIVIDDGSSDGTGDWVKGLNDGKGDPRVVYHWQENRFMGHARNRGMDRMRGEYAIFLDSDDKFSSDKSLAVMVDTIKNASPEVGRVAFIADVEHQRYPADTVIVLDYADFVCRIKRLATYTYLSIIRSAIAKQFPWQENRAFSEVRDYDMAQHCNYMLVNKVVWNYMRDRSKTGVDNAGAFHGFVKQMPDLIDNVSLLIARHKDAWLAKCPSIYAERCYEVAFFISLTGTLRQHLRLPRLMGAVVRHGDWRMWGKALIVVASLPLPPTLRQKLYALRYRIAQLNLTHKFFFDKDKSPHPPPPR
ncbi:MAG: glycosyltransferase family 2 protein, partial [Proteobacteria bacterium]|nr:glycosyltransferase family 2 protein [Pseudomonadota bacterium]